MCRIIYLATYRLAVGELPKIEGNFGCAVPVYHTTFANGVFHGMDFGDKTGIVTNGSDRNGIVYGYHIEFGSNQYHNNTAPVVACFCWRRTS